MPLKELVTNILCTYSFTHTLLWEELKVFRKMGLNLFYGFLPATAKDTQRISLSVAEIGPHYWTRDF
jgi:hypothetical protein